ESPRSPRSERRRVGNATKPVGGMVLEDRPAFRSVAAAAESFGGVAWFGMVQSGKNAGPPSEGHRDRGSRDHSQAAERISVRRSGADRPRGGPGYQEQQGTLSGLARRAA